MWSKPKSSVRLSHFLLHCLQIGFVFLSQAKKKKRRKERKENDTLDLVGGRMLCLCDMCVFVWPPATVAVVVCTVVAVVVAVVVVLCIFGAPTAATAAVAVRFQFGIAALGRCSYGSL